jgi:O-antigen/teichoic acid export membrane protein
MFSRKRFAFNSLAPSAIRFLVMPISFVITPYIVLHVGFGLYGTWALISTTLGYITLLDMALGTAYVRTVADRSRERYLEDVNGAAWALTWYNLGLTVLASLVLIPFASVLGRNVFHIQPGLLTTWHGLIVVACLIFALSAISLTFNLTLQGLQYIYEASLIDGCAQVAKMLSIVAGLHLGLSVWALALGSVCEMTTKSVLCYARVRCHLPGYRWLFQPRSLHFFRRNFTFSLWMQISRVTDFINQDLDAVLIGILTNTQNVGYYQVGTRLASLPSTLVGSTTSAYFPELVSRVGRGDLEAAKRFYWNTLYILAMANGLLAGGTVALAATFIPLWFQREVPNAALVAALMSVTSAAALTTIPAGNYAWAHGKSAWVTLYGAIGAVINVGVTIVLAQRLGFLGVMWGSVIGISLGSAIFVCAFHRRFIGELRRAVCLIGRVVVAAGVAGIGVFGVTSWMPAFEPATIYAQLVKFLVGGVIYVALYALLCIMLSLVDYRAGVTVLRRAQQWTHVRVSGGTT